MGCQLAGQRQREVKSGEQSHFLHSQPDELWGADWQAGQRWGVSVLAPFLVASGLKDKPVLHSSVSAVHHVDSTNMPL